MLKNSIDYYFSPASPWAYLGHDRFIQLCRNSNLQINVRPIDLAGNIFPKTGGLPAIERPLPRRKNRIVELKRFSQHLQVPLNVSPAFFPVNSELASKVIVAVDLSSGSLAALKFAGLVMTGVWKNEVDISSPKVLHQFLQDLSLSDDNLAITSKIEEKFNDNNLKALDADVFGSPSYVFRGEMFFGQDRIEFLQRSVENALISNEREDSRFK